MAEDNPNSDRPVKMPKIQINGRRGSGSERTPHSEHKSFREFAEMSATFQLPRKSTDSPRLLSSIERSALLRPSKDKGNEKPIKHFQNPGYGSYCNSVLQALATVLDVQELSEATDMNVLIRFEGLSDEDLLEKSGRARYAAQFDRAPESEKCPAAEAVANPAKLTDPSSPALLSTFELQHSYEDAQRHLKIAAASTQDSHKNSVFQESATGSLTYLLGNINSREAIKEELLELAGALEDGSVNDRSLLENELKFRLNYQCSCENCGAVLTRGIDEGWVLMFKARTVLHSSKLSTLISTFMGENPESKGMGGRKTVQKLRCLTCTRTKDSEGRQKTYNATKRYTTFAYLPKTLILGLGSK